MKAGLKQEKKGPIDSLGRTFRKLRVSLTEQCNSSCLYCDPEYSPSGSTSPVPAREMAGRIMALYKSSDLRQVHLTGGEPLIYRPLAELIEILKGEGVQTVTMTTNGRLLEREAPRLIKAGLDSANVSLDTTDKKQYVRLAGKGNPEEVIRGIDSALDLGLRLKTNATLLRGLNHDQTIPLMEFARNRNIRIRYIELMSMGLTREKFSSMYYSQDEIISDIRGHFGEIIMHERTGRAARYFELSDGYRFGIIANSSDPFCSSCDRLRMDHTGRIYGCLTDLSGVTVNYDDPEEISRSLATALGRKSAERFGGSSLSMRSIGG